MPYWNFLCKLQITLHFFSEKYHTGVVFGKANMGHNAYLII